MSEKKVKKTKKAATTTEAAPRKIGKIEYDGESLTQAAYAEQKGEESNVKLPHAKAVLKMVVAGDPYQTNDDLNPKLDKKLAKLHAAMEKDISSTIKAAEKKAAEKAAAKAAKDAERAAAKAAKEAEKAAAEEKKQEMTMAVAKAEKSSTAITKPLGSLVDDSVKAALGDKFVIRKDGRVAIAKGKKVSMKDFAAGVGSLEGLIDTSGDLKDKFCLSQARFAIVAKENLGEDWVNLFAGKPGTLSRVKKYMKVVEDCPKELLETMPINNIRALSEAKYSKDDEENVKIKKQVFDEAVERIEGGENLTQVKCKELATSKKVTEKGQEAQLKNIKYVYVIPVEDDEGNVVNNVVGSSSPEPLYHKAAAVVIDLRKKGTVDDEGDVEPITPPDDDLMEYLRNLADSAELIEDEESEEEEESDDDGDEEEEEEPTKEESDDDDDEEEEEDESDDDDDDEDEDEDDEEDDEDDDEEDDDDDDLPE